MQQRLSKAEKSAQQELMEGFLGRRLLDPFSQSTRKDIDFFFVDKVSRHHRSRFSVSRLHLERGIPERRQNFPSKTLPTSARSEKSSQKCLEIGTAATAAAGHIEEHRETCSGAQPRHPAAATAKEAPGKPPFKVDFRIQGIP